MSSDRYDRQTSMLGWNQEKLEESSITLVGSGPLCNYVATALTGLGVGTIRIFDNARSTGNEPYEFLLTMNNTPKDSVKVASLTDILHRMNDGMAFEPVDSKFYPELDINPTVIVDLTNNPHLKMRCLRYAKSKGLPFISASSDYERGSIVSFNPRRDEDYQRAFGTAPPLVIEDKDYVNLDVTTFDSSRQDSFSTMRSLPQGSFTSGVIAGLVLDEIRKFIFQLSPTDLPLEGKLYYDINSSRRFERSGKNPRTEPESWRDKKVLVGGAGALGNYACITLALMGVGTVVLVDPDTPEATNANRQPCPTFEDYEGMSKVEIVKDVMKKINPSIKVDAILGRIGTKEELRPEEVTRGVVAITDSSQQEKGAITFKRLLETYGKFDAMLGCFDTPAARCSLNDLAIKYRIPLIDGGTDSLEGQVAVFVPGETACINCILDLESHIGQEPKNVNRGSNNGSCIYHPPSVVYTNLVISSLMCGELETIFSQSSRRILHGRKVIYYSGNMHSKEEGLKLTLSPNETVKLPKCGCSKI